MDMNGADASAAAGLNTTKLNWHYTGPALPQAEAQTLLADGNNGPVDIHMAQSGCAARLDVGPGHRRPAVRAGHQRGGGALRHAVGGRGGRLRPGFADGLPRRGLRQPCHRGGQRSGTAHARPRHVDGLVYATTPTGAQVLAAAMYILPATETRVPMPYGALVQWHRRTQVCGTGATTPTMPLEVTGYPPCPAGSTLQPTPYLSMVWQVPVAGGPLAIQPPDIQIVEAAVMASGGT